MCKKIEPWKPVCDSIKQNTLFRYYKSPVQHVYVTIHLFSTNYTCVR